MRLTYSEKNIFPLKTSHVSGVLPVTFQNDFGPVILLNFILPYDTLLHYNTNIYL